MKKIKNFIFVALCIVFNLNAASFDKGWQPWHGLGSSAFAPVATCGGPGKNLGSPAVLQVTIEEKLYVITEQEYAAILKDPAGYLERALVLSLEKTIKFGRGVFDLKNTVFHDNVMNWILVQSHAARSHPYDIIKNMHEIRLTGCHSVVFVPNIFAMIKHFQQACVAAEPGYREEIAAFKRVARASRYAGL